VNTETASAPELLLYLAGLKKECPDHPKDVLSADAQDWECRTCENTGEVPKYPELREECPRCAGKGQWYTGYKDVSCIQCGGDVFFHRVGRGWVPISNPMETVLRLARKTHFIHLKSGIDYVVVNMRRYGRSNSEAKLGADESPELAVLQAFAKAQKESDANRD